jgi:tetratricopeptide (TPR) repeat protein
MKKILTLAITLFTLATFGQNVSEGMGQQMTSEEWDEEAKTNIRLLPKYGHVQKTEDQKKSDQEFIETVLKKDSTNRNASDHLISIGFQYLHRDIKKAMYRFNQAYLLDSTNTDIYWGFGGVYMTLGDYANAKIQYQEGLAIHPNNTHLLTDYGTYFMAQHHFLKPIDEKGASKNLDSAVTYMTKSFQLDPTDQNTTFKLSICYWNKGDCDNAWKYYDISKALGGQTITEDYTNDLKKKCKRKK